MAGFSLARGHFVVQVPYDQFNPWSFREIALRIFTNGYDYYAAETSVEPYSELVVTPLAVAVELAAAAPQTCQAVTFVSARALPSLC